MNFPEIERALITKELRRNNVEATKMTVDAWTSQKESPGEYERARHQCLQSPIDEIGMETATHFRRSIDRFPLEIPEAELISRRANEFQRKLKMPLPEFGNDEYLKTYAADLLAVLSFVLIPALAQLGRYVKAVKLVQAWVAFLRQEAFQNVFGAQRNDEARYLMHGPAVSALVVYYPSEVPAEQ